MNYYLFHLNAKKAKTLIFTSLLYLFFTILLFLNPKFDQTYVYYAIWIFLSVLAIFPIYYFQDYLFSRLLKKKKKTLFESFLDQKTYYYLQLLLLFFIGFLFVSYLCIRPYFTTVESNQSALMKATGHLHVADKQSGRYSTQIMELNTIHGDTLKLNCSLYMNACDLTKTDKTVEVTYQKIDQSNVLVHTISSQDDVIDFAPKYNQLKKTNHIFTVFFFVPSIFIFWLIVFTLPKTFTLKKKIYL